MHVARTVCLVEGCQWSCDSDILAEKCRCSCRKSHYAGSAGTNAALRAQGAGKQGRDGGGECIPTSLSETRLPSDVSGPHRGGSKALAWLCRGEMELGCAGRRAGWACWDPQPHSNVISWASRQPCSQHSLSFLNEIWKHRHDILHLLGDGPSPCARGWTPAPGPWGAAVLGLEGVSYKGQSQRSIYCTSCVGTDVCFVGHQENSSFDTQCSCLSKNRSKGVREATCDGGGR